MSQALTRYDALYQSLRSRRRRPETLRGLDSLAGQMGLRLKYGRVSLRYLRREAEQVDTLEPAMRNHSDRALDQLVMDLREVFHRGRQDDDTVRRSLAAIREVARRETGEEPYIVQLMGALALYHGRIIEMLTGEGKTLTGSLAAPLLAWRYRHVHVLTVNDYLAQRDADSRRSIYSRCGCAVGAIVQQLENEARFDVYARPIVYGTPKQITADWLRDQIRPRQPAHGVGGASPALDLGAVGDGRGADDPGPRGGARGRGGRPC